MKKLFSLLTFLSIIYTSQAQTTWCASDEELNTYHELYPQQKIAYQQELMQSVSAIKNYKVNKANGKIIIPLAIHVIHYNGIGNISKSQIDDGVSIINTDFNKLNPDTASVRAVFQSLISNPGIEFRLAKIDPAGNPTEGITRTNHHFSNSPGTRNNPKTIIGWDRFSYLNVWIVNSIVSSGGTGTILGFAQFPPTSGGQLSTYGLVVRADEWGSIELAQSADGRTVTHEIGHCLNLLHTFQNSCGSFCQGSGDFVCDTPPQFDDNNNSCSFSLNTCSNDALGGVSANPNPFTTNVPDQLENYMGYGLSCLGMFSEGQKTRMISAMNTYQKLDSITSDFNEIQTGTNDGYTGPIPKPVVEIYETDKFTCEGGSITFSEDSYGGPLTNYSWSFPGGTPSSSTNAIPTITYNTKGTYDVVLRVSNSSGIDSIVLSNYVHVGGINAEYSAFNYVEGFESDSAFNKWVVVDEYLAPTFIRLPVGNNSTSSAFIANNNAIYKTSVDKIISPSLKMTDVLNPSIGFDIAYKRRSTGSNTDEIKLYGSVDCGASWLSLITMTPAFFAYDNSMSDNNFVPSQASQWKSITIPSGFINSTIKNGDNVRFMFEVINGRGNNIFIDNFKINGQPTGIKDIVKEESDFIIYPNPAKEEVNINFNFLSSSENAQVYVQNILGEKVAEIYSGSFKSGPYKFFYNSSALPKGIYFVTAELDGERITRKLVVN